MAWAEAVPGAKTTESEAAAERPAATRDEPAMRLTRRRAVVMVGRDMVFPPELLLLVRRAWFETPADAGSSP